MSFGLTRDVDRSSYGKTRSLLLDDWYTYMDMSICICIHIHICTYMHSIDHVVIIRPRIKNIGLETGLGGHFATKVCNRRGCSATNPSATIPLKTTVLYTEVRDKGL